MADEGKKSEEPAPAEEPTSWTFQGGSGGTDDAPATPASDDAVEWTASEFVSHEKGVGWYLILALVALVAASGVYFVTKEVFSSIVIIIMALMLGVAGAHKPRVVAYRLNASGLTSGKKFYPYSHYKSFTMPEDGPFVSIVLKPLKRFDLPVGAFLAPDSQQKALQVLSEHLPLERGEPSFFDTLMRQLRF